MQGVAGAVRHHVAEHRTAEQRQVADRVENLVADAFVFEAQRVQHAGVADDDGVLERAAQRQPLLAHPLHFLQEAEGAGRGDVVGEALLGDPGGARLVAQQRVVEADGVADLEVIRRVDGDVLVALATLTGRSTLR